MRTREIAPGLLVWTVAHPAWEPGAERESPADWPRDVGCVLAVVDGHVVLVDPLVPEGGWTRLDEQVAGRPVHVLRTIDWHSRSCDEAMARYGGEEQPPPGVRAIAIEGAGETMFWLEPYRALVPGDRLLGDGRGGLRRCPESWLGYLGGFSDADLAAALRPLLDLPVEHVLVSHGEPVLGRGHEAIAEAIRVDPSQPT
jgi:hypothetical protein